MRYDRTRKDETHRRLLTQASTGLRADRPNAVELRAMRTDAGLTHGAFDAYFPSRAALVATAVAGGCAATAAARLEGVVGVAPPGCGLDAVVATYLGTRHVAGPARGCVGPTLAAEVAREDDATWRAFAEGMERIVRLLARQRPSGGGPADRLGRARTMLAAMIGAVEGARGVPRRRRRERMLRDVRRTVLDLAAMAWPDAIRGPTGAPPPDRPI